jgi:hypothetical protein
MNKEFIPYEQALALKEIGFNEPCFIYWVHDGVEITFSTSHNKSGWSMIGFKNSQMIKKAGLCSAPTFSQVFRWFREKYGIISFITYTYYDGMHYGFKWIKPNGDYGEDWKDNGDDCKGWYTYEEAELACLKKLIQIVKQENNGKI